MFRQSRPRLVVTRAAGIGCGHTQFRHPTATRSGSRDHTFINPELQRARGSAIDRGRGGQPNARHRAQPHCAVDLTTASAGHPADDLAHKGGIAAQTASPRDARRRFRRRIRRRIRFRGLLTHPTFHPFTRTPFGAGFLTGFDRRGGNRRGHRKDTSGAGLRAHLRARIGGQRRLHRLCDNRRGRNQHSGRPRHRAQRRARRIGQNLRCHRQCRRQSRHQGRRGNQRSDPPRQTLPVRPKSGAAVS